MLAFLTSRISSPKLGVWLHYGEYVYVCICMYTYVYVCICMYMYVYVCICMYMYVYVCMCMYVCMYVYANIYLCIVVHVFIYSFKKAAEGPKCYFPLCINAK